MQTILPYVGISYLIFLLVYWLGVIILLYHLKRFGLGRHAKRMFYIVLTGSIIVTILTSLFCMQLLSLKN